MTDRDINLSSISSTDSGQSINLPSTWFENRITLEQVRSCFSTGREEIRIASGFFTVKGWGSIRKYTQGKRVYLLVGIDEPGEERARTALVKEIMHHLATGLDRERRQSVGDLVDRMSSGALYIMDARASSHHGKLYIFDCHTAINCSANTTGRGFFDQIESGGLYAPSVAKHYISKHGIASESEESKALHCLIEEQVANFINKFDEHFDNAFDITQELLAELRRWLNFVPPWDIYLKTILALEQIKPVKTSYGKQPVSYQRDMIARALRQIENYGGSMLVASTGLGKTVMGTHIAIQLRDEELIDKVIVVCPNPVRQSWKREMREASISVDCFTLNTLDKTDSSLSGDLENWEDILQEVRSKKGHYLLILDESHQLRKRYPEEFGNRKYRAEDRRERRAFTRINELVNLTGNREKVKVLLLTGSPYATEIKNINTQLSLLPHTSKSDVLLPDFFEEACAWKVENTERFLNLPVTHQLTAPHVAKYYTQEDSQGLYLEFGNQKKYFPKVTLHSLWFPLLFEQELSPLIIEGYFNLNTSHPIYRKNIVTQVKTSWGSSPRALLEMLERTADTPSGAKEFDFIEKGKSDFAVDRSRRQEVLNPLLEKLNNLDYGKDIKLQAFLRCLRGHCPQEKVIVFCERHATAFYLERAVTNSEPSLKVFSTITKKNLQKVSKPSLDISEKITRKLNELSLNSRLVPTMQQRNIRKPMTFSSPLMPLELASTCKMPRW